MLSVSSARKTASPIATDASGRKCVCEYERVCVRLLTGDVPEDPVCHHAQRARDGGAPDLVRTLVLQRQHRVLARVRPVTDVNPLCAFLRR